MHFWVNVLSKQLQPVQHHTDKGLPNNVEERDSIVIVAVTAVTLVLDVDFSFCCSNCKS